ncbi:site-specific integrase [Sulfidibacter corallicola]|uniref:Site-specific integrase n=1 Tax=Sulfidibacter corallicola TaxID=2818388 RepID=A0A8A4TMP6_SULCO|nr:site-specific integrase [Sulfidibacter corallicola]
MLRKYFAQQCYLAGLNQYEIQGLLNHSDVKMIQAYTQHDQGHLRASLDRAFGSHRGGRMARGGFGAGAVAD